VVLGACSARDIDDFPAEIPREATGAPAAVLVELWDFRTSPETQFLLANPAGTERLRRERQGNLPMAHKQLDDERMGQLLACLSGLGFDDYARPSGHPPAALPAGTRRVLSVRVGSPPMRRMIDVRGMGAAGHQAEVAAMSEMSRVIQQVSNETLSLRIDAERRSAEDLLRQPGLRRSPGAP